MPLQVSQWTFAMCAIATVIVSCDRSDSASPPPAAGPMATSDSSRSLYQRLVEEKAHRQSWPAQAVKIPLNNPDFTISLMSSHHKPVKIDAWNQNQNDFHVAMMRIDDGDALYAITEVEYEELRIQD